jgi:hypothetical protein
VDEDPTTEELHREQREREAAERRHAEDAASEDATDQHERRADKAEYLRQKLEERAESERSAGE